MKNMSFWLFKPEPEKWSWDDQLSKGLFDEPWDGIRNFQASNNMKIDDLGFFIIPLRKRKLLE